MTATADRKFPRVVIVGSGFAGLAAAIQLKKAGVEDLTIFEKGHTVGGVWRENHYPGATCDVAVHLYSFSFEPNPNWSREFAPQPEILAYQQHCAIKYGLMPHLRFNTEVTDAVFDEDRKVWRITTATGEVHEAEVFISACGQLSRPSIPKIPGLDSFGGTSFHAAEWDHDYDLTGKRVAVIGTGASAIQFVPQIAGKVEQLHVFQKEAEYIFPKPDFGHPWWQKRLFRHLPVSQAALRLGWWGIGEAVNPSLMLPWGRFRTLPLSPVWLAYQANLRLAVRDKALREALTPDYQMGCRRILTSSNYYPTLTRPNVELVTDPIREITPHGLVTAEGVKRDVDVIIFGTGFQSNNFVAPMTVRGLGGHDLNELWREGARAYLGMSVAGFPNFFLCYGPNTNLGGGSIIYMLERQAHYITEAVKALHKAGAAYLDVRREAFDKFDAEVQRRLAGSVWAAGGCVSWYQDKTGRVTNNWPGLMLEYQLRTRKINLKDYRVVA